MLSPAEWEALRLSARVALWATLLCLPCGILVGWLLARREFRGKFLVEALVQLPMVLPPVVPGYALLLLLGMQGPIGRWLYESFGITLAFTWKGAVIASAVMAFPLLVQPVRVAFRLIDSRPEQAATTLGATPWNAFLTVALPLALLAGLLPPRSGTLSFRDQTLVDFAAKKYVPAWHRHFALVFQDGQLFPHLTVQDNLLYGYRRPAQLAGGERQRGALGRALFHSPRLLLPDEPLAALDERLKQQILPFLRRVKEETHLPMLYVSHARAEVEYLADRTLWVDAGRLLT